MQVETFAQADLPETLRVQAAALRERVWPSSAGGDASHTSSDKVTMGDFFTAHALRYQPDFTAARIGLYPGEIDRLW